jgi:hypothetical protein
MFLILSGEGSSDIGIEDDKIDAGEIDIDRIKDMPSLTAFKNRLDEVCALTISSQSLIDRDIRP